MFLFSENTIRVAAVGETVDASLPESKVLRIQDEVVTLEHHGQELTLNLPRPGMAP
jgi:hypothetical protein